ncbi:MAG TPA: SRPBCC family protein [Chryseolinea sp.]|nr:SRPBCC family protein [Chryseolinea sp.]HPH46678.1 SRPBCC family protein [Chryseolinea sp.]HPM30818.1 SRPBCC family protein [Chryseolinea sp.]
MKALKIIGIILVVIVAIGLVAVVMQPGQGHIEKSIVINAPAASVFAEVSDFEKFNVWSPWAKMDPEAKQTVEGTSASVGHKMAWDGPKTGTGSMWTEEIRENEYVKNGMKFGGSETAYYSEFILTPEGEGTKISWTYDGPNEGLSGKAMWLVMGSMMSSQYEQGLKDLKEIAESKPAIQPETAPVDSTSIMQ